jgi:hypothetical protein
VLKDENNHQAPAEKHQYNYGRVMGLFFGKRCAFCKYCMCYSWSRTTVINARLRPRLTQDGTKTNLDTKSAKKQESFFKELCESNLRRAESGSTPAAVTLRGGSHQHDTLAESVGDLSQHIGALCSGEQAHGCVDIPWHSPIQWPQSNSMPKTEALGQFGA